MSLIPLWIWSVNDTETDRYLARQFKVTGYITKDDPKNLNAALEALGSAG